MNATPKKKSKGRRIWRTIYRTFLWLFTIFVSLGLVIASFGGDFHPAEYKGICLMVMLMPAWMLLMFFATVLDFLWNKKALIICIPILIICGTAMWDFCPLNVVKPSEKKYADCPKFTMLTYNTYDFQPFDTTMTYEYNPGLSYVISTNADILCLQENYSLLKQETKRRTLNPAQIDTIAKRYPYILMGGHGQVLMSKYPAEVLPIGGLSDLKGHGVGVFRVNIEGHIVTIINVHLFAYGLSKTDKNLYTDITDGSNSKSEWLQSRTLMSKIQRSAVGRADEADELCSYVTNLGGPNLIVAGDFNDVPGCYTLRRLEEYDLKSAYSELGFGPMITYYDHRFYFRIDHIMYRGNLQPLRMSRGSIKTSDHYPLLTTFALTPD